MGKIILLILFLYAGMLQAYDPYTHRAIAREAFSRSTIMTDTNLLSDLGLDPDYRKNIFPNSLNENKGIFYLVQDGAEFEDASTPISPNTSELRVKHHFYDPQDEGRGLFFPPIVPGFLGQSQPSPNWALEDFGEFTQQEFSYSDANDSFHRALTWSSRDLRDRHWGEVFQRLGHVIHHIQDMAQPQHTRNDAHSPINRKAGRFYETYTENKRANRGLPYTGYPDIGLSNFNTARSFWGSIDEGDRKGMAWFSSSNFVSAGTNFFGGLDSESNLIFTNNSEYPLPSGSDANQVVPSVDIQSINCESPNECIPTSIPGKIVFIETPIYDANIDQSFTNERASTFGIFDYDLIGFSLPPKFTLNRFNYDAAHEFLIPRAVAYSAGLINYFFRGRIEAALTADGDGLEVTNISNGDSAFQTGDSFEVYYETNSGVRELVGPLTNLTLESDLDIDRTHTITGLTEALKDVSDTGDEGKLTVIFDGTIGKERGVATTGTALWNATVFRYINIHPDAFYVGVEFLEGVEDINEHPINLSIKIDGLSHVFEADTYHDSRYGFQGETGTTDSFGNVEVDFRFLIQNRLISSNRSTWGAYRMGHDSPGNSYPEFEGFSPIIGVTKVRISKKFPPPL